MMSIPFQSVRERRLAEATGARLRSEFAFERN
jgi:hypothetical protein